MITALLIWAGVAAALWAVRIPLLVFGARRVPRLVPGDADRLPPAPAKISVIVAAKDEAAGIADCVEGLLRQDHPDFEVVIVDDRSSDNTADIVEAIAARDPRVRLVRNRELPAGWFGKAHAVHVGVGAARGEWLCLTDADCRLHHVRVLRAAAGRAAAEGADFVTLLPLIAMRTWWQKIIDPLCSALVLLAFDPRRANDPARMEDGAAFAGFMLMSRAAHTALGGHHAVAGVLGEDVELGRRAKASGGKLLVLQQAGLLTTESYPTFAASFRGWSRVLYAATPAVLPLAVRLLMILAFGMGPHVLTGLSVTGPALGWWTWETPGATALAATAAAGLAAQFVAAGLFFRWAGAAWPWVLAYLPGAVVQFAILARSLWMVAARRTPAWRGTTYPPK